MNYNSATVDNLSAALTDARSRTLALVAGLSEQELMGKVLSTVNPLRWEIAHTAYFHEVWVLRHLGKQKPLRADADFLFDSITINHADRWDLPLPSLEETFEYMNDVLKQELELLRSIELNNYAKYFYLLALFHEDMHNEAFMYTRQTLSYPTPKFEHALISEEHSAEIEYEDISIPGGSFKMGAERDGEFIFDNEKWAHKIQIAPFKIAKYAVSNEQFLEFVEANGYKKEEYWDEDGWEWCVKQNLQHPVYWKKDSNGGWLVRKFDQWTSLRNKTCSYTYKLVRSTSILQMGKASFTYRS